MMQKNHGIYHVSGTDLSNAPHTGNIYGFLEVTTNNMKDWVYSDNGSWIWQTFAGTDGAKYERVGVNSSTMSAWKRVDINGILLAAYPVGSIYMSVNNTNPSNLFGGTWAAWGTGRVPVGIDTSDSTFNTVEKTGGSKTVTLTTEQIPSHNHQLYKQVDNNSGKSISVGSGSSTLFYQDTNTVTTLNRGGGQAHTNLQPYITCYMWKRTA